MLDSNENRSSSPELILPTDTTSDQAEAINKNSIELETEQPLQGSLAGNQDSLNDYVDANSTPVSEGINDTMQVADDNEVTSGNKGNRSVVSSDSTPLSEGSVNEQEDVTESKKEKGKRSASKRLQQSKEHVNSLEQQLKEKDEEITQLKQPNAEVESLKKDLEAKDQEIAQLNAQKTEVSNLNASLKAQNARVQQLEKDKAKLETEISTSNAEVSNLNAGLKAQNVRVQQLEKENKELEAKNKTLEQSKQGNGARYTATVGMGLAAGLIAFTALERTVRLEMLVMIGIAVTSALVVGGITYAALPSTQIDKTKTQGLNENGKKK